MVGKSFGGRGGGGGESVATESDNWNVADLFMKVKVLKLLISLDKYETMSQFGVEELGEEIYFSPNDVTKRRKEGLFRFASTLRQLLGNTRFALKKDDVIGINEFLERIRGVEECFEDVISYKENMITKETEMVINERLFNMCFSILQNIKEEINFPLNKAGLIFRASEEVDLDAIMKDIVEGG